MRNSKINLERIVVFYIHLIVLPSLLVSSWLMKVNVELPNDLAAMPDAYYDNHFHQQIVFLDYFVNKFRQDSNYRLRELHIKSSRYETSYLDQQVVEETAAKKDYSSGADYHNEVDFHDFRKKPPFNGGKKKKKKSWKSLSRKKKASIILGSIGVAFDKKRLISLPSLGVSEDVTITTSTTTVTTVDVIATATTTTTTDTTTTPTTTTDTTIATSMTSTAATTTTTMPNLLLISIGTYVTIRDRAGTSVVANPPMMNTPYTTVDNTLVIKSLASSANADELSCSWITV